MKKRGFLSVIIILLLTISILGILLTVNPLIIPLNYPSNSLNPTTKSYTGSGDQLNALLYITNNYDNTPNATNTTSNIYIPCPSGWKIIWANLTLSNINAPNTTIEPNASSPDDSLSLGFYAMSFQLTNNAYLDNVSVQLTVDTEGTANFYVYNAIDNGSGVPKPQNEIKMISSVSLQEGTNYWKDVDFGHEFLNISNTYDNTFFIAIQKTGTALVGRWRAIIDSPSPGAGHVYYYTGAAWSDEQSYDCKLRVNVSASTSPAENALPSEIGLTINGSQVSDISKGNGEWINSTASSVSTGYIFYDVNSTWMSTVSFSYIWNVTYAKGTYISANTNFVVNYDSDAFWNVTVDATDAFPLTGSGVNHINITGIPTDWSGASSMAYNDTGSTWIALDSYPPDTISFLASNGTWIVNCTATNYVSDIGFEVGGILVENATLYDNLNITVNFDASVTGTANLNIYDPNQILNRTEEKSVSPAASTWFIWDVSNNATSTGMYNVTVSFKNGLVVGYNETPLEIVPLKNTSLTVTSYPSDVEYPGPVPITLYYSRTDTGQGLPGADIAAYEGATPITIYSFNDHGNGSYSFDLDFGTNFGVHDVHFNASGLRLFEANGSSPVSINYTRELVSITIGFEVGVVPVENATLYDNLNITVTFDTTVSETVNLSIYDPSQILNHTEEIYVSSAASTWFIWNVSDNATGYGTYNVTVSLDGALVVGYNETLLEIVPLKNTSLTVISYPSDVEFGPVPITLYYNSTDTGQGLSGATITAYFENSTPVTILGSVNDQGNGFYSLDLDFDSDFGVHNVKFNASDLRLFESNASNTISINYTQVLVSIQLDTPSSVVLGTSLVASAHLWFTTNSSNFVGATVYFNFSLRFSNGSSIVIQRNDTTNAQGLGEGSILVPIDTVDLNVTAFYMGTGTVFGAGSSVNSVGLTSGPAPDTGLVSLMFLMMTQQGQNFMLYLLLGAVIGSVVVAAAAADRVRRRRAVPGKALRSLENIIVDHIATGATLWTFDFLRMEHDVALVSGFMAAVKSFMGEMQKGGLRKLETELGTFIREDGDFLTVTCITCGNTTPEENWIRERLRSFLSSAEQQHWEELETWRGDLKPFKASFPMILASVIDLDKAEKLQRERLSDLQKDKEKLRVELNKLGSQLENLDKQFKSGEISESEFKARKAKIEPDYDQVQKDYIHASLSLSRAPPELEAEKPTPETTKEMEKIQERFLKIRMEIEGLRRKELDGTISSKDIKRRDKLQKEIVNLIEKLDKFRQK